MGGLSGELDERGDPEETEENLSEILVNPS
jgi:hypothetical protein